MSFNTLPHSSGVVGKGSPSVRCHIAEEQWAIFFTPCHTSLGSSGQWVSSVGATFLRVVEWAVYRVQQIATLWGSKGQWISFSAMPHCWGAVGSRTPFVHC